MLNSIGYTDFHNLTGFTSKRMPNIILKNVFLKKFYNRFSKFLRIRYRYLIDPNESDTGVYVHNDPKFFFLFFLNMRIKNSQNFTLISNPLK